MLFTSTVFLLFFLPLVTVAYYIIPRKFRLAKNILLLAASLFFYAWGEPKFVLGLVVSIIANYLFGLWIHAARERLALKRLALWSMVVFNLSLFFVFKYLGFFVTNLNLLLSQPIAVPSIALPIGISFFTFQAMSYVISVYRGTVPVQKNLFYVALYISFFPQLIAGPIVRYETIAEELTKRKETFDDFSRGMCRFIMGMAKKILLANTLAILADKAFALQGGGDFTILMAWLGVLAYAFQIYFDFSGYSDMAIGLGWMFGFHFLENFHYPYISKSITEFWRRWHISLGTWFRDYVYFPLGGSRVKSKLRLLCNLFVVWFITGLWHGASWNYIAWGLLFFVFIAAEKLISFRTKSGNIITAIQTAKLPVRIFMHVFTLLIVLVGWVLFRSPGLYAAVNYLFVMFGLHGAALSNGVAVLMLQEYALYFIAAAICSTPVLKMVLERISTKFTWTRAVGLVGYAALFLLCFASIVKGSYNPFIYFNF